jgi:hypothetical protein
MRILIALLGAALLASGSLAAPASAPPTVPQDFLLQPQAVSILLTWQPPVSDGGSPLLGYYVHRGLVKGGSKAVVAQVPHESEHRYIDTDVLEGATYYYELSAYNADGEGPRTGELYGSALTGRDRPDLRVRMIDLDPPSPEAGDALRISVIVENRGGATSPAALVRVQVDGQLLVEKVIASLPPGTSTVLETFLSVGGGSHVISAFVDPANLILEPDEVDNYAIKHLLVPEPQAAPADAVVLLPGLMFGLTAGFFVVVALIMMRGRAGGRTVKASVARPPARRKR